MVIWVTARHAVPRFNVDGTTTWKDHVAKVKSDNPIPTE